MSDATVLVVNAGSGSLKLAVLAGDDSPVVERAVDGPPDGDEATAALTDLIESAGRIDAVGHRIVHGSEALTAPCIVDDRVVNELQQTATLAPLHVPPALNALALCREQLPDVPHIVCPDTAFHLGMPPAARTYPVPASWRERFGIRRFGFHGLSYAWALQRAATLLRRPAGTLNLVMTHLGGGASVCAVAGGRSVWTSMGFTPLEGLPMSTRSGSVDPGMLLWLQQHGGMAVDEIADGLEHHSGLLGLSDGLSGDTRVLVHEADNGHAGARFALEVYCLRVRQEIAAAAANLPSLDALVFTGEIGADQPEIRESVCAGLTVLGIAGSLSTEQDDDRILSALEAAIPVLLIQPREDRQIAAEVRALLENAS